jgi:hypothetical protein
MPRPQIVRRAIAVGVLPVLTLVTAYSVTLAVRHGLYARWGGGDFHPYWYYGHYVREGRDPYHRVGQPEDRAARDAPRRATSCLPVLDGQGDALMLLSGLEGGALTTTIAAHLRSATQHAAQSGMHLSARFASASALGRIASGTVVAATAALLVLWARRRKLWERPPTDVEGLYLLNVLCLLVLLAVYHRGYDASLFITFVAVVVHSLAADNGPRLSTRERDVLGAAGLARWDSS